MVHYTTASTDQDLEEILELQKANRPEKLSDEELQKEGFVSARHDLPLLRAMNSPHPHVIAKDSIDGKVIGYTLCLLRTFDTDRIPCLDGLINVVESASHRNKPVKDWNYVVMGQVCIDKEHRGKGLFSDLYDMMRKTLSPYFDCIVTSVSDRNPRSLKAHAKIGFHSVHGYSSNGEDWEILLWDWTVE